jgi:hypothetical protein
VPSTIDETGTKATFAATATSRWRPDASTFVFHFSLPVAMSNAYAFAFASPK